MGGCSLSFPVQPSKKDTHIASFGFSIGHWKVGFLVCQGEILGTLLDVFFAMRPS